MLLKNYLFGIIYIPLRIFFRKVDRIFCYKFITDPFRFFLTNLISSEKTKIYVSDQFYKFYNFSENRNQNIKKKFLIIVVNLFCKIKLKLYGHLEKYRTLPELDEIDKMVLDDCISGSTMDRCSDESPQYGGKVRATAIRVIEKLEKLGVKFSWAERWYS